MARRSDASAGTPATVALTRAGIAFTAHAYEHDPRAAAYGLEAAEKLGLDPERVFKTLLASVDGASRSASCPWRCSSTSRRSPRPSAASAP